MRKYDLSLFSVGSKFSDWTVVEYPEIIDGETFVFCRCKCGNTKYHLPSTLYLDQSKMCKSCATTKHKTRHGMSHTPEHNTWREMRKRCNNPSHKKYHRYGGRGIKICRRWDVFENFYEDMGDRPEGMSIDRKNNNKDYTPDNCRWATDKQQSRNRSTSKIVTFEGQSKTVTEWAEEKNISLWFAARLGSETKKKKGGLKKITDEQVIEISLSKLSVSDLCINYKISPSTVRDIQTGHARADVTGIIAKPREKHFTANQALEIFHSDLPRKEIAEMYGCTLGTIKEIKNGRTWSKITGKIRSNTTNTAGSPQRN